MSDLCLLVEPIDPAGTALLKAGGLDVRLARAANMASVRAEIGDAVAVIIRDTGLDAAAISAAPRLRVIGNHGAGTDPVDLDAATAAGIPVVNTPGANAVSVAEQALALMLAVAKTVPAADQAARRGDFAYRHRARLRELAGCTLGIVGYGRIGRATAGMARALAMEVLVYAPRTPDELIRADGLRPCARLDELLAAADVVSLHLPLRSQTRHLLGARELARMRPGAILINTARGALVDEAALARALADGRLGGAGLDVFEREPLPADSPLLSAPNLVLAPHVAGSTDRALARTARLVAEQVLAVLSGARPAHLVNPEAWERRRL